MINYDCTNWNLICTSRIADCIRTPYTSVAIEDMDWSWMSGCDCDGDLRRRRPVEALRRCHPCERRRQQQQQRQGFGQRGPPSHDPDNSPSLLWRLSRAILVIKRRKHKKQSSEPTASATDAPGADDADGVDGVDRASNLKMMGMMSPGSRRGDYHPVTPGAEAAAMAAGEPPPQPSGRPFAGAPCRRRRLGGPSMPGRHSPIGTSPIEAELEPECCKRNSQALSPNCPANSWVAASRWRAAY